MAGPGAESRSVCPRGWQKAGSKGNYGKRSLLFVGVGEEDGGAQESRKWQPGEEVTPTRRCLCSPMLSGAQRPHSPPRSYPVRGKPKSSKLHCGLMRMFHTTSPASVSCSEGSIKGTMEAVRAVTPVTTHPPDPCLSSGLAGFIPI